MAKHRGKPLLSNHQKSWLWGTLPVSETLREGIWPVYEVCLASAGETAGQRMCREWAEQRGVPIRRESSDRLTELCKARDHQGVLALLGPFPYTPVEQLLGDVTSQSVLLLLDHVQDAYNFGAIIRSAAAFGAQGAIISSTGQVPVNSHVARSSAGAVNCLPICRVEELAETLGACRAAGFRMLAATMQGELAVHQVRETPPYQNSPLVLIIGNEAEGVSPELLELCDATVRVPMSGPVESLNAAVAASILLFQLTVTLNPEP